jgi:opacity protein-like surface antigen
MRGSFAWIVAAIAVCVSSSALAQDVRNERDGYIAAKLLLGFGGEAELEVDGLGGFEGEDDMETGYGLGVAYMHPLHDYFALGGQLAFFAWTTDAMEDGDFDRSTLLDLDIVPQGKVAVADNIELYASLPLGLTLDFFGEDDIAGAEIGSGFGFNLGLLFGVRVALNDDFGLLGELGYVYHSFSHPTDTLVGDGPDLEVSMGQLAVNVGGYFQL